MDSKCSEMDSNIIRNFELHLFTNKHLNLFITEHQNFAGLLLPVRQTA